MSEKIINVSVPMLASTLDDLKRKAGTNMTKIAVMAAVDVYLASEKSEKARK